MERSTTFQEGLKGARPKGLVCGLQTGWLKTQGFARIGSYEGITYREIRNPSGHKTIVMWLI